MFLTDTGLKIRHQLILISDILVSIGIEKSLKYNHKSNKPEEVTKSITKPIHHPTKTARVCHVTLEVGLGSFPEHTSIKAVYVISNLGKNTLSVQNSIKPTNFEQKDSKLSVLEFLIDKELGRDGRYQDA